jgi:acetyltransferase-like isoleucine patch superfamily enzyme
MKKLINIAHFLFLSVANHLVCNMPSYTIRKFLYIHIYRMKIGAKSNIQMGVRVYAPWNIVIGDNCSIGYNSLLDGRRKITIFNNVDIAGEVRLMTLGHDLNDADYGTKGASIVIMNDASLFMGVSVLPGVTIAEGSAVGMNALVTKDTDPWCIYGGNPARKIGARIISQLDYKRDYKRYFH